MYYRFLIISLQLNLELERFTVDRKTGVSGFSKRLADCAWSLLCLEHVPLSLSTEADQTCCAFSGIVLNVLLIANVWLNTYKNEWNCDHTVHCVGGTSWIHKRSNLWFRCSLHTSLMEIIISVYFLTYTGDVKKIIPSSFRHNSGSHNIKK